jgi:sulfide:quinone oxidoreductase
MKKRVLVLGAGFGGLELSVVLSELGREEIDVTIIDKSDAFVFGYSKLDYMFGKTTLNDVKLPYADLAIPGVTFKQEEITRIEPEALRVTTDRDSYEADYLVIALGADYDFDATPGLRGGEDEFYSVEGARRMGEILEDLPSAGRAVVGVCGAPFKCPPAPSEAVLLLHDHLLKRGMRDRWELSLVMPFGSPIPPSPEASVALVQGFAERDIRFITGHRVHALDHDRSVLITEPHQEIPFDLFLGVPRHRAPDVVIESGLAVDGYVPSDYRTMSTGVPRVYAFGDVASVGVPKAGVFSEGQARVAAASILASINNGEPAEPYDGRASCYVEFGDDVVGRVDIDFLTGPRPTGGFHEPSMLLAKEKAEFGSSRRARWFGK